MRPEHADDRGHPFATHVLASLPAWLVAGVLAFGLYRYAEVPWWLSAAGAVAWITKDLVTYPWVRAFYVSSPASRRIVGERGVTLSDLAPRGLVRVHGEIWQAETASPGVTLPKGCVVCVKDVHGLRLVVDTDARQPTAS